jgi:hypothetical protein
MRLLKNLPGISGVILLILLFHSCKDEIVQVVTTPKVTTAEVTDISNFTATCGGEILSEGKYQVFARGVCWSTKEKPTITDSITLNGAGAGKFTSLIRGLSPGTSYFIRAYAKSLDGTGYGDEISFSTLNQTYDLFPLHPGNKYYYSYTSVYQASPYEDNYFGKKCWTILSDSLKSSGREYYFEEVFNGTEIKQIPVPYSRDTIIIKDRISHFKVIQDISGVLSFSILSIDAFQRYQTVSEMKVQKTTYGVGTTQYTFNAGFGLKKYSFYRHTNQYNSSADYTLDSARLYH